MPGMIQAEGSPLSSTHATNNVVSPPLQSFSELSLASIRSAISSPQQSSPYPWLQELKSEERGLCLIQLLLACANYVSSGNMDQTNVCLEQISLLASLTGDPMQRVATYLMEGLAARITKSWPGLHKALYSTQLPSIADLVSARQVFFSLFPYLKFAFNAVNLAILDAMEGEKVVHVIDLDASEPAQWIALLQSLSNRDGGPPHLKITGINEKREVLQQAAMKLTEEAERLDIPFQFNQVVTKLENLSDEMLGVKTGEAVAISSVLQLHPLLAEEDRPGSQGRPSPYSRRSVSPQIDHETTLLSRLSPNRVGFLNAGNGAQRNPLDDRGVKRPRESDLLRSMFNSNHPNVSHSGSPDRTLGEFLEKERTEISRPTYSPSEIEAAISRRSNLMVDETVMGGGNIDRFLRMLRSLSPKVVVVVEQESNHNGATLMDRFVEALHYYSAMFDSVESTLPQQCIERVTLEKHLFGQQIQNIVACEGSERVERHEKLERWMKRLDRAGFAPLPLSYATMMQAKRLVHGYSCEAYRLLEDKGCLTICWQERPLYSVSAWQS